MLPPDKKQIKEALQGFAAMNKEAITKHDIYRKLVGLSEQDLQAIAGFIDSMRLHKPLENKKMLKLEGLLRDHEVDFSDLKRFKEETWRHVEEEFDNG